MNGKRFVFCLALAAVLACAATVRAGLVPGAPWQRGDAGTTYQEWYFNNDTGPLNIPPDMSDNPYGAPKIDIMLEGVSENIPPGWLANYCGRTGIWHSLFTQLNICIPNSSQRNQYKEVWAEVGFNGKLMPNPEYPDYPGETYGPRLTAYVDGAPVPACQVQEIFRCITWTYWCWWKLIIAWRIEPNPDSEKIYLAFHNSGADIDYVTVDTRCYNNEGVEGCTPGYWKVSRHFDSYPAGYTPNMLFVDAFGENAFPGKTLLQVLWLGGGGLNALGRHAVAALLNAASAGVSYDLTPTDVISMLQAVYPGTKEHYEDLKNIFAGYNEQGCPLN